MDRFDIDWSVSLPVESHNFLSRFGSVGLSSGLSP